MTKIQKARYTGTPGSQDTRVLFITSDFDTSDCFTEFGKSLFWNDTKRQRLAGRSLNKCFLMK